MTKPPTQSFQPERVRISPQLAQLIHELASESYGGDDLTDLCRTVYVRVLFRMAKVNNGGRGSKELAYRLTGMILKSLMGYAFDPEDVQALLDGYEGYDKGNRSTASEEQDWGNDFRPKRPASS